MVAPIRGGVKKPLSPGPWPPKMRPMHGQAAPAEDRREGADGPRPTASGPTTADPGAATPPRRARLSPGTRALLTSAVVGGLVHLLLGLGAVLTGSGLSYFGVTSDRITATIQGDYLGLLVTSLGRMALAHLVLGAGFGLIAWRLLALLRPRALAWPLALRGGAVALAVLGLHGLVLGNGMARYPQLYVEGFYSQGGVRAAAQLLITETLPTACWATALLLLALLWAVLEARRLVARPSLAAALGLLAACGGGGLAGLFAWDSHPPADRGLAGLTTGLAAAPQPQGAAAAGEDERPRPPNLLLLAADSLRPDRIEVTYPAGGAVAPVLQQLQNEGVSFTGALSVMPRTFPAWISMLTGQAPHHHGIRHMFPTAQARRHLPPALPRLLAAHGYATAVLSDFAGDIFTRVDLGFDRVRTPYFHFPSMIEQRALELDHQLLPYAATRLGRSFFPVLEEFAINADPELLTDRVLHELDSLPEPWLAVVFYSTAHFPYAAPAPYYRRFTDPAYRGPFKYHKPHDLAAGVQTAADVEQVRRLFDGTVRAIDDELGRLLGRLAEGGKLKNTVVIATADHGENLYDGELGMGHGDHLRGEPSLRIPLIFWAPGRIPAGQRIPATVRSYDLAPTLLDLAGVPRPRGLDGESLLPLWQGGATPADRPVLVETGIWFSDKSDGFFQKQRIPYPDLTTLAAIDPDTNREVVLRDSYEGIVELAKHRALYFEGRKILYLPTPTGVRWELYDPLADPLGQHDLAEVEPQVRARGQARLLELLADGERTRLSNDFLLPRRILPTLEPAPAPAWLQGRKILTP